MSKPLRVVLGRDMEFVYAQVEGTTFEVYADTVDEALCRLGEQLKITYETYAHEKDENLTDGAIRLKQKIIRIYEEVRGDE